MNAGPIRVALIGMGKIARDQHLPAVRANRFFALVGTVSPDDPGVDDVPHFAQLDEFLAKGPAADAVVLCTPPQVRYELAAAAIARDMHVFLEKPPGATLSEVAALAREASRHGVTLFAGWHSRFAACVAPARAWLAGRAVLRAKITWREDVRVWHPGQKWIWEPGGLGVFDPGINALSIATHILPRPIFLTDARLQRPANRAAPIAAQLAFSDATGMKVTMDLDWRQTGPQTWEIVVETADGTLTLSEGGLVLTLPHRTMHSENLEYPGLYDRFATLIRASLSDVDTDPLRLVADAFLRGKFETVEAFED
jgi:D-galactose 1-dehydrogenase